MISNSGHDENGRYSGGQAGDQGGEWVIQNWYNRPWSCILRHPDKKVREEIAKLARAAALNNKIGYDQNQRTTFWNQLEKVGYDPAKITVACEADCSAGVSAIVKAVGYRLNIAKLKNVSKDAYTGNLRAVLKNAGFECFTESKYRTSASYLLEGDILLYDGHHTCINLDNGSKAGGSNTSTTSTILRKGDSGSAVKTMQTMLIACGYSCGSYGADGDFGTDTLKALKNFQKDYGLEVDGEYGSKSKTKLEIVYKEKTNTSKPAENKETLNKTEKWVGKTTSDLNVRNGAGTENKQCSFSPLKQGTKVSVCDTTKDSKGADWYYIKYNGKYGFVSAKYVKKV